MLYEFDQQQTPSFITAEETDEQLMARIQTQDQSAMTVLYRRHTGILRTVISRVVNNDQDVDDLVGEVMVEVWKRAASFDQHKGKVLGWLITMARRRAIDKVRRRQAYNRAEERLRLATETEPAAGWHNGGVDEASTNDRTAIFNQLLQSLPEAQSQAVKLAYYSGLSQREISARINVPLGTIKTRLELGVRKLRAAILAMGGVEEWSLTH